MTHPDHEPEPAPVATDAGGLSRRLAELCPDHRIDLAGAVALPCPLPHADRWRAFVAEDRHAGLEYLTRDPAGRLDPTLRTPWGRTLLVFAHRYTDGWPAAGVDPSAGARPDPGAGAPWIARVARYARGLDYHDVFLRDIKAVLQGLRRTWPRLRAHAATDTGPYLEREYAWLAGLGFLGRSTCLIHEKLGSGLFLGVALTNLQVADLPPAGTPATEPLYGSAARRRRAIPVAPVTRCGSCTACIDACPTQALLPGGGMDARRCISTWTIEKRGELPPGSDAGGLLFGCDVCQEVCPWNVLAAAHPAAAPPRAEYQPLPGHAELSLADLADLADDEFRRRMRRTPLWRAHPDGLRRNARRVLDHLAGGSGGASGPDGAAQP